eukprot:4803589-Ditylum_brightwellii.AAC.1
MSKAAKWKWTSMEQETFKQAKKIVSREVLLVYPEFNVPFDMQTNASDAQLEVVISQCSVPISFYSYALNNVQKNYTIMEKELFTVVETLKEFLI